MKKKVRDYLVLSCFIIGTVLFSGCSKEDTTKKTGTSTTPKVTASPSATEKSDVKFEEYKTALAGTWTSSNNTTYTFDFDNNYSKSQNNRLEIGEYWFTTDDTGEMVVLCMESDLEIENSYYRLTMNSGSNMSVVNGDGETETWTKG